ncbi:hypothetical protein D9758_016078 [Tetrapyrgos nigripes]|uniref:Protein-S-isoprenylcysteine O-methyltransferase n=1 Tax=Tetrapyrgos nigripes TaxID=182062 RepID=A0A8H5C3T1_9AGAR|nr:hypothetical protein D9758_016078 [Tetrapyrgos nigripes]
MSKYFPVIVFMMEALVVQFSEFIPPDIQSYLMANEHKLITTGPYSIIRHPSHAGSCLCLIGVLVTWGSKRSLVRTLFEEWMYGDKQLRGVASVVGLMAIVVLVAWTCNFFMIIMILLGRKKEDQLMEKEFGNQWIEWKKSVPYKLVPRVY